MEKANYSRLKIIFLSTIIFLIALSIFSYIRINNLIDKSELVSHSNIVNLELEKTFSLLKDAESNQRGFILTLDSIFYTDLNKALELLNFQFNKIDSLTKDNLSQHINATVLLALVHKRTDYLKSILLDVANARVTIKAYLGGKSLMDDVRKQINKMEKEEDQLLNERILAFNRETFVTPLFTIFLILSAILILIASYFKIIQEIKISYALKSEIEILDDSFGNITAELGSNKKQLKESEVRIQTILQYAPDAVITINENGIIMSWNPQAENIFGWKENDVLGKTLTETIIPERYREQHTIGIKNFLKTGEGPVINKPIEIFAVKKNKNEFPVELKISSSKINGSYMFIGFVRDISIRKQGEKALKNKTIQLNKANIELLRANETHEHAEETGLFGSYRYDFKTQKVNWSDNLYRILGCEPQEFPASSENFMKFTHPDDVEYVLKATNDAFTQKHISKWEYRMIPKNGKPIFVRGTGRIIVDKDGLEFMIGTLQDITAEKEHKQKIIEANESLQQKNQEIAISKYNKRFLTEFAERFAANKVNNDFFNSLVQYISDITFLDYVLVGKLEQKITNESTIHTISLCAFGKLSENISYPLPFGPCEQVIGGTLYSYPQKCKQIFPKNQTLVQFNVEGYLGYPLQDFQGNTIGLIAVMHQKAIEDPETVSSLLKIVAKRAEIEMERIKNEETLKNKTNQLVEAQQLAHIGSWEWDVPTNKIEWSDELYRIYGLSPQKFEANYENYLKYIHPDDREYVNSIVQKAFKDHQPFNFFHKVVQPDGTVRILSSTGKVFTDDNGNTIRMSGTAQDVTVQKKYEEELKESEERFFKIFDNNPIAMTLSEIKTNKIKYANNLFYSVFGYSNEEIIGYSSDEINLMSRDENEKVMAVILGYLQENRTLEELQALSVEETEELLIKLKQTEAMRDFEVLYTRKNGETFSALISYEIIRFGNKSYTITSYLDITERKKVQEQLKIQNEKLVKINKELEAFNYVSSHDLQEPLRKIQIIASRIIATENQNLSDTGKDYFNRMQQSANRMQSLIKDLLAYSRTNTTERKFEKTDLNSIIEEIKSELKETIEEKQAIIEATEMCDCNIIPFQFRQLMTNLIANALKFSKPEVSPRIILKSIITKGNKLNNEKLLPEQNYCHITISDNGIGFEPQYSEKIFEIFQRINSKDKYAGTGIGLAIVKKIVENHFGIITATSHLNKGATFDIFIPSN